MRSDDPPGSSTSASTLELLVKVAPILISGVTVAGYATGYLAMEGFADELGVTVDDLGFDTRDYLLFAGLNAAMWIVAAAILYATMQAQDWANEHRRRSESWWRRAGLWALASAATIPMIMGFGIFVALGAEPYGVKFFVSLLLAGVIGPVALLIRAPGLARSLAVVALLAVWIGSTLIITDSTRGWAQELKRSSSSVVDLPVGPVPARFIARPHIGTAGVGTETACAIRVGESVLIGTESVTIHPIERFTVSDCDRVRVPFG